MAIEPTQLQIAAILGPDNIHFETLISHLMSDANEQQSKAEILFNFCKQTQPDSLSLQLSQSLSSSPNLESRAMSAVRLRKLLTENYKDDSFLYNFLSPSTQFTIKSSLLLALTCETTKSITKKLCDTVSELAAVILPNNN